MAIIKIMTRSKMEPGAVLSQLLRGLRQEEHLSP